MRLLSAAISAEGAVMSIYGIWCVNDHGWCFGKGGPEQYATRAEAETNVLRWKAENEWATYEVQQMAERYGVWRLGDDGHWVTDVDGRIMTFRDRSEAVTLAAIRDGIARSMGLDSYRYEARAFDSDFSSDEVWARLRIVSWRLRLALLRWQSLGKRIVNGLPWVPEWLKR